MHKGAALLVVIFFLAASSMIAALSAFSSTSIAEDSWQTLAPMPTARRNFGVAVVDDKIFAIGGRNDGINLGTNEMYDPVLNTWITKTSMPTPRIDFSIAVYESKIYVFGGISAPPANIVNICATTEVYDPATDTWETKALLPTPRLGASASVVSNKIYVIGGYQRYDGFPYQGGSLKNEVYDPETDTWTERTPIEYDKYDFVRAVSVVDGNRICVIGGETGVIAPSGWSNLNRIYDTTNDTWTTATPIPVGVESAAGAISIGAFGSKRIYVFGGFIDSSYEPCNLTQIYNPDKDVWVTGAQMSTPHAEFGVANVNDELYAIGGSSIHENSRLISDANEKYLPTKITEDILVLSPQNKTYEDNSLPLTFAIDKPTSYMGYNLDGQETVTVTGNTTLSGMSSGSHNLTIYAMDESGKLVASETITFTIIIPEPEQFSTVLIVAVSVTVAAVVALGVLVYFRKRKRFRFVF